MKGSEGEALRGPIRRIGVVLRRRSPEAPGVVDRLRKFCEARGVELLFEEGDPYAPAAAELLHQTSRVDLLVALGGDGTLLTAARALVDKKTPLLGINLGRLGFLADVSVSDFEEHMLAVIGGKYSTENRFFIEGKIDGPNRSTS